MNDNQPTSNTMTTWLFRSSAILWAIWGLVHILAGVVTLNHILPGRTAEAVQGITSKVPLDELQHEYHPAVSAVLSQHAMNLAWFGLVTVIAAPFVWKRKAAAVYIASLVGGLADLAYFIFIDLGGFATFPGPQMTYICAAAIALGLIAARRDRTP